MIDDGDGDGDDYDGDGDDGWIDLNDGDDNADDNNHIFDDFTSTSRILMAWALVMCSNIKATNSSLSTIPFSTASCTAYEG